MQPRPQAALVTLRNAQDDVLLSFEIEITPAGAVVRGRAAALEIDASTVATRCDEFRVEARDRIELRSGGVINQEAQAGIRVAGGDVEVQASPGAVRVRANDDVQLLGEQVLLNCDRQPPLPAWTGAPAALPAPVPRAGHAGDAELVDALGVRTSSDAAP